MAIVMLLNKGCIEPFEAYTQTFESALVIQATITDEMKHHVIQLARTFPFEADGPQPERQANVKVIDSGGSGFVFMEDSPGIYVSEMAFALAHGREYYLEITTANGNSYRSATEQLAPPATLDEVYAERITNEDGVEGMAIRINSSSPEGNARNYRYEYEETFKIIAPKWKPRDLAPDPNVRCGVLVVLRENEEQLCYGSQTDNTIIITNTNDLDEDRVQDYMVRFIRRDNYILTHRYSILVRQLVLSDEAYTYYETLDDFSASESLFSETQPGFLLGNVFSVSNPDEKVLGYFEVASVDEKRIFFDYDDFFPGEPLPPYIDSCVEFAPTIYGKVSGFVPEEFLSCVLRPLVEMNLIRYVDDNDGSVPEDGLITGVPEGGVGPYAVVPRVCGDCTVLGKVEAPEFWVE
jgi:hypothetical protein